MEDARTIEFLEIRDFSKKMNATFGFIRQNFRSFFRCMMFITGPPIILGGIFTGEIFNRFVTASTGRAAAPIDPNEYFNSAVFWLQLLGIIVFLWIAGVGIVATVYGYMAVYDQKRSNDISVREVWLEVKRKFWRHFWTMFMFVLIGGGIALLAIIPLALLINVFSSFPLITAVLMIAYFVLTFYFLSNFSLIFICRDIEGLSFGSSVQRILYLLKEKTWSTCGTVFINTYIQTAISLIFYIPWYIFIMLVETHSLGGVQENHGWVKNANMVFIVFYFLLSTMLYALPLIGMAFQYFNLVEAKESRGLMRRIESFGSEVQNVSDEHY